MTWVDYLVTFCAGFELACFVVALIGGPFLIGKPRDSYSALNYVVAILLGTPTLVLAGRCLGWW